MFAGAFETKSDRQIESAINCLMGKRSAPKVEIVKPTLGDAASFASRLEGSLPSLIAGSVNVVRRVDDAHVFQRKCRCVVVGAKGRIGQPGLPL